MTCGAFKIPLTHRYALVVDRVGDLEKMERAIRFELTT